MRNRRRPSMDPWGTPDKTGVHSELDPLTTTFWCLQFLIQWRMFTSSPRNVMSAKECYVSKGLCGTESNAFWWSKKMAHMSNPFSSIPNNSRVLVSRAVMVFLPTENPYWLSDNIWCSRTGKNEIGWQLAIGRAFVGIGTTSDCFHSVGIGQIGYTGWIFW